MIAVFRVIKEVDRIDEMFVWDMEATRAVITNK